MAQYLNGTADAQVKLGAGKLYAVFCNSTSSGTFRLFDTDTGTATGDVICPVITPTAGSSYLNTPAGIWFDKGLYIDIANTIDYTIVYE